MSDVSRKIFAAMGFYFAVVFSVGHADTGLSRGEWWARLQVETVEENGMVDKYNFLGWLNSAKDGKDFQDLEEPAPFGTPYLTITFPKDQWGDDNGDYNSDYRKRKHWRKGDEWDFVVRTDKAGRQVTLSWEGYDGIKRFGRMRLIDEETGQEMRTVRRRQLQSYTFTMAGTEHRFKWVYKERPKT